MAHTVAEFEMAVLCAFQYAGASLADTTAQTLKQQAEAYCAAVKASATGWQLCLELFESSSHDQAKFYALQTLQTMLVAGIADDAVAAQLRTELLAWLRAHGAAVDQASPFLKTKLAVVVTLLIKRDYTDRWPTAFSELMALLPTGASMVELFFRILTEINTEIVEFDAKRTAAETAANMRIKDAMRESSCMAETFDAIYNVLVNADVSEVMTRLSVAALDVLKRYIAWVDISLIVNDRFMPLLFTMLRTSPALRCPAANCIIEVIDKGMTPEKKLALMTQLRLLEILPALPIQDDEEFAVEVAELVNGMGLELIECIDAFRHEEKAPLLVQASTMLGQLMPLVWDLFAHDTKNVSEEVFEVVNSVGTQIRAESEGPHAGTDELFQPTTYLPQILHGIYRQIRYPQDDDDTDEAEFEEYRRSLFKIYVNITRKRPLETLAFLSNLSQEMPTQVQFVRPRAVEAFISLVHRYMEGIAATKAKKELESPSSPLTGIVIKIHANMIAGATLPHSTLLPTPPAMLLAYYDLAQRYSRVLQNQSQLIPALLDMMFGVHGLTNPSAHVRSRVCYLCLQLVKSIGTSIQPHGDNILRALVPRLVIPDEGASSTAKDPTFIPYDDQVYLFELAGQVIASQVSTPEAMEIKYQYTKMILEPLVAALNTTLTAYGNGTQPEDFAAEHCGKLLNAIANVSKAFKSVHCMANQQELFTSVLTGTSFVLQTLPRHRSVRSKVVFALHRFIAILDSDHLLANVSGILEHLMFGCRDATDVLEMVQLLDQLILRYKSQLFPFFDQFTLPFVHHVCGIMPAHNASADSETKDAAQLEREAVQKYLYLFLLHVTAHDLSQVLVSSRNVGQLENVLLLVLEACGDVTEPATNRAGFTIVHELVAKWLLPSTLSIDGLTPEIRSSFTQFVVARIVPAMFTITQKHHFELHDAQCAAVIKEIRTLHEVLLKALGDEFLRYLQDVCLPSLGCPPDLAASYAQQVATGDDKTILAAYKQFVSRMK